ncbi:hypothetical protein A3F66_04910 [candidate division TM6 bacterium RIFCSPHIGHO2_12_FULL_32_22]|nr:MAG: hypothetical protein A3F66_04910 [candidate division TM6 bacterium RIFCSPHIGHO2_12_FULL_32_22]
MKRIIFLGFLLFVSVKSEIIESDTIKIVDNYLDNPNVLVVFDIDNTLAAPKKELGSDEWFNYLIAEKMKEGFDSFQALNLILPKYFYAQFNVPLILMESDAIDFLDSLKDKNIDFMSLTARSLYIADRTLDQLHNISINFSMAHKISDCALSLAHPAIFKEGILFSGSNDKGESILAFFDANNYHPKKVIFLDDKYKNLLAVENALLKREIQFVGIRYSGADEKVKNFNPEAAKQQLQNIQNYHRN